MNLRTKNYFSTLNDVAKPPDDRKNVKINKEAHARLEAIAKRIKVNHNIVVEQLVHWLDGQDEDSQVQVILGKDPLETKLLMLFLMNGYKINNVCATPPHLSHAQLVELAKALLDEIQTAHTSPRRPK